MSQEPLPQNVSRISISLPNALLQSLDEMMENRGFHNRSQAIADMIQTGLLSYYQNDPAEVMAGMVTLVYDESRRGLMQKLVKIQRDHVAEVIGSQHVLLENAHVMEVWVVQGPVHRLQAITDQLVGTRGVSSVNLTVTSKLLPPVHARRQQDADAEEPGPA
ncbi:MAG: CopG family transcriptional regulator nickel-responsive regulator [Puniceicoccaceae bacterium 5H]|nr:MAG: CopG family transcriptional regulator nickel-responsive regulator [Puniceicoccaceae bacterium 5H]